MCEDRTEFCGDLNETLMNFECLLRDNKSLVFADIARVIYKSFLQHFHANLYTRSIQTKEFWLENCVFCSSVQNSFKVHACKKNLFLCFAFSYIYKLRHSKFITQYQTRMAYQHYNNPLFNIKKLLFLLLKNASL